MRKRVRGMETRPKSAFVLAIALILSRTISQTPAEDPVRLDPDEARRLAPAGAVESQGTEGEKTPYNSKEAERFRVIRRGLMPEEQGSSEFRMKALEGFMDYDEAQGMIYGQGRTQIFFGNLFLEGDKVIFDNRLQEVQADGHVILRSMEGSLVQSEMRADSMRYSFADGEGVGFNPDGKYPPYYFKGVPQKKGAGPMPPQFQPVSPLESLFHDTRLTTCDFKIPHFFVRAREIILFHNDRIFLRSPVFYVMGAPVFYFPFFSRSLTEPNPWFVQLGYGSRTGARIRFGYEYNHETNEPSLANDKEYETRSKGQARLFADYLSSLGYGAGFDYHYDLDYHKHVGDFEAYGIEDSNRQVFIPPPVPPGARSSAERWRVFWQHREEITPNLDLKINVDWISDPEIYYDVLDVFTDRPEDHFRQMERRAAATLTYLREAYVARLMFEIKDRIGLDRYTNFEDPADNDHDFNLIPPPFSTSSTTTTSINSIDDSRWGRVSERLPQFTLATRYLPICDHPLFYMFEINAYNNLDKGLNIVSTKDDAMVEGIDVYNQFLYQYRITERYVILAKLGFGLGAAQRSNDDIGVHAAGFFDGLTFTDANGTFLVGTKPFNLKDIQTFYAWVDSELRFNARFSDALTGYLMWKYRETTRDFIGDFYAQIGDVTSRQDLYNYRLRQNWLLANLNYRLIHPNLNWFANAGLNLKSRSELYPNENEAYWNTGIVWLNRRNTVRIAPSVGWSRLALYAPSDPRFGDQDSYFTRLYLEYIPLHGRWFARVQFEYVKTTGSLAEMTGTSTFTFFSDERPRTRVVAVYGAQLGPKWNTEFWLDWEQETGGLRDLSWFLSRDLHDALAILRIRFFNEFTKPGSTTTTTTTSNSNNDLLKNFDFAFALKRKLPDENLDLLAPPGLRTVRQEERQPITAY